MAIARLEVRLDQNHKRKLKEMADEQKTSVSEVVRRLIDEAYEEALTARRKRAVEEIAKLEIEDVPDPETVSPQLEAAHEPGGLY